jgi:hypothetical protein
MICNTQAGIFGAQDIEYLKKQDAERLTLSGTLAEYYSLNRGTNVDPLYGEPSNDPLYGGGVAVTGGVTQVSSTAWDFAPDVAGGEDPFVVSCGIEYVEFDNRTPSVRPDGTMVEYDAVMSLSIMTWECQIELSENAALVGRVPKRGDVVYVFGEWWDVVKDGKSGNVRGTSEAVGYRLYLKKRSQFTPDRKV